VRRKRGTERERDADLIVVHLDVVHQPERDDVVAEVGVPHVHEPLPYVRFVHVRREGRRGSNKGSVRASNDPDPPASRSVDPRSGILAAQERLQSRGAEHVRRRVKRQ